MAIPLLPIAGALVGGLTGYLTSPDDNKFGGTITGGLLGGLTGGIGGMASKALGLGAKGLASAEAAATATGRIANSGWNPISLLKSAYTPDASGLFNLGMDALPLISDIANNDVGAKSFTGFAGTIAGSKFGGRELNQKGVQALEDSKTNYIQDYTRKQLENEYRGNSKAWQLNPNTTGSKELAVSSPQIHQQAIDRAVSNEIKLPPLTQGLMDHEKEKRLSLMNDPRYSRQGYNMAVGMGADMGLYSLTAGMNKPKDPMMEQRNSFDDSPVSRYIQMTGVL